MFCVKLKRWLYQEKLDLFFYVKEKKNDILTKDPHSWDKVIIHTSHKNNKKKKARLQTNFQFLLLNFKLCNFVTKKTFF